MRAAPPDRASVPGTILCAVTDDDRLQDVVTSGRAIAAGTRSRALFVHVAEPAVAWPAPFGHGAGAAAPGLPPDPLSGTFAEISQDARESGHRLLADAGVSSDEAVVVSGNPVNELNRLAVEHDALLIVAGTHRRGLLSRAVLGSTSRALARHGACPVLIARSTVVPSTGGPVVCGVDAADPDGSRAAQHAARLAAAMQRSLVLVHVICPERPVVVAGPVAAPITVAPTGLEKGKAERALKAVARRLDGDDIESVVVAGRSPAERLDEFATGRRADLLVVGSSGRRGVRAVLDGSTSLDLLRRGQRPLVIVPPADRSQPKP